MFEEFRYHQSILHSALADYEQLPGWEDQISAARSEFYLPREARDYLAAISDHAGVPIKLVGVGPGRRLGDPGRGAGGTRRRGRIGLPRSLVPRCAMQREEWR